MIRAATTGDAPGIARIYNHYVETTVATFEDEAVEAAEMAHRIAKVSAAFPWLVDERSGAINGFAYAAPWNTRSAYRYTVETTAYVAPECLRRGTGLRLYQALIDDLRARGIRRAIAVISLPNDASIALHERMGFGKAGELAAVGWKMSRWVDVGYWELSL